MEYVQATRRAVAIGQGFAMLLMMIGLVWNVWLVLIGFFLFLGAQMEDRSVVFQSVLETVRMEEVMLTQFSILSPADTLEDALSKAAHTLQDDFPVVRGIERYAGRATVTCSRPWCAVSKLRNGQIPWRRRSASWERAG